MVRRFLAAAGLSTALLVSTALLSSTALRWGGIDLARAAEPLAAQDTNLPGISAEITQARRKDGVLTVQMRLVNGSSSEQSFYLVNNQNYDAFYVVAKNKKYFVLRDSEKTPLAPPRDAAGGVRVQLKPGASWTWWARYPAPPREVTSVSYYTPVAPPFDDVPVTDVP